MSDPKPLGLAEAAWYVVAVVTTFIFVLAALHAPMIMLWMVDWIAGLLNALQVWARVHPLAASLLGAAVVALVATLAAVLAATNPEPGEDEQ